MQHFSLIDTVNVEQLASELEAHPDLWDEHTLRKDYETSPHKQMSDIWVRFAAREDGKLLVDMSKPHLPVWYRAWQELPALRPIVFNLMARVEGEVLGGVLVTRIPPGCGLVPHRDSSWHVDYYSKYYLSIQSEPGAVFGCREDGVEELLEPKPGEIWLFDNHKLHWVDNKSNADRITCIICIRTEKR